MISNELTKSKIKKGQTNQAISPIVMPITIHTRSNQQILALEVDTNHNYHREAHSQQEIMKRVEQTIRRTPMEAFPLHIQSHGMSTCNL